MKWVAAADHDVRPRAALDRAIEAVLSGLEEAPDLVLAFSNPSLSEGLAHALEEAFPSAVVVGASAGGVIGQGKEMETGPSVSLTGASLPGCTVHTLAFGQELMSSLEARHLKAGLAGGDDSEPALILCLVDPRSGDPTGLLRELDSAFPGATVVGGVSSGDPQKPALLVDGRESSAAAVLIAIRGEISVSSMISQGCRPIGEPMLATRSESNLIYELGQKKPMDVMQALHQTLSPADQVLFQASLFLGIEMRDQVEYKMGDFLIRNIMGIEPKSGALAVAALVEQFKAVQFHLRDGKSAREELCKLLELERQKGEAEAVLLFSCLGRGFGMFEQDAYESSQILGALGPLAIGGFFCGGEIGPVADQTHLHAYTSAAVVIRRP